MPAGAFERPRRPSAFLLRERRTPNAKVTPKICPLLAITNALPADCAGVEDRCAWFHIDYDKANDIADGACTLVHIADALKEIQHRPPWASATVFGHMRHAPKSQPPVSLAQKETAPGEHGRDMWEDFLQTTICGDGSIRGFLQMVSGMAMIGTVYHEGLVIACGGGSNGKKGGWWGLKNYRFSTPEWLCVPATHYPQTLKRQLW